MVFFIICVIFSPAQLFKTHFFSFKFVPIISLVFCILYFSLFQISYFAPSFSYSILPFPPSSYFCFNFIYSLAMTCFYSTFLLLLPHPDSQNYFCSHQSSHIIFPLLKYLYSLSIFINLHSLVVPMKVVVVFFLFYSQIFTIFVFQISNFTIPLSYFILPSLYPFFFSIKILLFPCLSLVFILQPQYLFSLYSLKITFLSSRYLITIFSFSFPFYSHSTMLIFAHFLVISLQWILFSNWVPNFFTIVKKILNTIHFSFLLHFVFFPPF